ncbi:DUF2232 domain-containing protein [Anaerococcus obesiensis]|uniref:DUF2232 domain-containing protein n=1 Tax=Anaerococcus obesiensis TaxID=1287640 RepID=A0A7T7UTV0_9FIRM|nr:MULTISPECIES: DUF2232 domain-containing protein [Anaerococcus]MDU0946375.1 DUF2232 domain-containing protein [Anaerococcus vaginalis]MDU1030995.1 DUF2232 domain-containing protein [Anaerococcus vaginalis]MDU5373527.1 DUF2232 domain-containing protein [Anaerococcus vaginalis]QQN56120.1 DUF2232 domain-containing protein [Anaerococcus obesiensis]
MNDYLKKNKKLGAIIFGLINVVLAFLSTRFLVFAFFIPIFTAIKLWELNDKNKMIFLFTTGLFSAILNIRMTIFLMSPMIIFGNVLYDLIKKNKTDKYSLKVLTIIFSVLSLTIIGYLYSKSDINFNFLVDATEKIFKDQNFKINKVIIRKSLKAIPLVFIFFSLIYSMISLKLVRNYLNYKNENIRDLRRINTIRIDIKDLRDIFICLIISVILCKILSFSNEFILLNSIMAFKLLFFLNGVLLIDYFVSLKKNKVARIINWFLLFIFFAYISDIIATIGFIDIFLNLRKKVRIA